MQPDVLSPDDLSVLDFNTPSTTTSIATSSSAATAEEGAGATVETQFSEGEKGLPLSKEFVRDEWINEQLKVRANEFTEVKRSKV